LINGQAQATGMSQRLSIVVPVLNEADCIVATLTCLKPLRARGHEVIVVDGGSRDESRDLALPLCDRLLFSLRGRARQMNAGAAVAQGDVLLFLHADTQPPFAADAAIAQALNAGRRWGRFDVRIDGHAFMLPIVAASMNLRSAITGIATGDQALFVECALFRAIGGFPEIELMEDVALSSRLKRAAGAPARVRSRVTTSGRRFEANGSIATILRMWKCRWDFWRGADPRELARRYYAAPLPSLLIFAKEPRAGSVKTRLAEHIGPEKAALLYRELVAHSLSVGVSARRVNTVGDIELCGTPSAHSPAFLQWSREFGVALADQQGDDLGQRMHAALQAALRRGCPALLIGTDCQSLDSDYLRAATKALETHDAVLGPAEDGGYVLIGLRRDFDLFSGVTWSRSDVMAQTRARLTTLGASWHELPTLWDVDTPPDLARFDAQRQINGTASPPSALPANSAGNRSYSATDQ
jgi:rSAM/selenodomain-associated transferase 2/rSAM/selenodomain-associated transferase 1